MAVHVKTDHSNFDQKKNFFPIFFMEDNWSILLTKMVFIWLVVLILKYFGDDFPGRSKTTKFVLFRVKCSFLEKVLKNYEFNQMI